MSNKTLRPAATVVALCAALALTACGPEEDAATPPATSTATATSTSTASAAPATTEAAPSGSASASAEKPGEATSGPPADETTARTPSAAPTTTHVPGTGDEDPGDHSDIGGPTTAASLYGGQTVMGALATFEGLAEHDKFIFSEAGSDAGDFQVGVAPGATATTSNPNIAKSGTETMTLAELGKRLAATAPDVQANIVWEVTFTKDGDIKTVKDS
ncbi:hypothetical protein [Streptomyces sp. NPDC058486]|uniref:hypothetical protein n=1 Tax=unclassified Streptomyces TaxID=2593676 RepID=UPI00365F3336